MLPWAAAADVIEPRIVERFVHPHDADVTELRLLVQPGLGSEFLTAVVDEDQFKGHSLAQRRREATQLWVRSTRSRKGISTDTRTLWIRAEPADGSRSVMQPE